MGDGAALMGFKKEGILLQQEKRKREECCCWHATEEQRLDTAYPGA